MSPVVIHGAPPDTQTYWQEGQNLGWVHLLPPCAGLRLLCISPYLSTAHALASAGAQVHWLVGLPGMERTRTDWPAGSRAAPATLLNPDALQPLLGARGFDGVVLHDPAGLLGTGASLLAQSGLGARLAGLVRTDGFLFAALPNVNPFTRVLRRLGLQAPPQQFAAAGIGKLLRGWRRQGAHAPRRHALLMTGERVTEILAARGYRSTKNVGRVQERIKQRLYSGRLALSTAPALAVLWRPNGTAENQLDRLLAQAAAQLGARPEPPPVAHQVLVLPAHKIIVTLQADRAQRAVLVVSGDRLSSERRQREVLLLKGLAQAAPALAAKLPRVLSHFSSGELDCVLLSHVPGVTLDQPLPQLDTVTQHAYEYILQLHLATARPVRQGGAAWMDVMATVVEGARQRYPFLAQELDELLARVQAALDQQVLPLVWTHGDYKVENVMFDPASLQLTGVIDWEHAQADGLPLLDLLYLLLYNRTIRGEAFAHSAEALLVERRYGPSEARQVAAYCAGLGIPASLVPALNAAFLLQHIGIRVHFGDSDESRLLLSRLMRALAARLTRSAG